MAILISQSASTVKKPTKNSVQFKATKKLLVEDDVHEAEVARGEVFYLDETRAGCFLYDPDPSGVFYKFKITKKVFKQLSKEHTLVVKQQKPHPKKPTPSKSLIPESPAYKGKITTTAPDVRLLAKKLSDFDPSGKFTMQKNGMYLFTSKSAAQRPMDLLKIADACNVTYLGPANTPGKVLFIPNVAKGAFTRINSSRKGGSKVGTFSGDVSIMKKLKSVFGTPSNAAPDGKAFNSYTFKTGSYVFSVYQWKVLDNTIFTINANKFDEKALSKFALFLGTNLYRNGEEPLRKAIKLADLQKSMEELNYYLVENYLDVKVEKRHGEVVEFTFTTMTGGDVGGVMASFSADGEMGMYIDSPDDHFKAIQKILANFPGNSVDQDLNSIRLPEYALMHLSNMELSAARILEKASNGESFLPKNIKSVPPAEKLSKEPKKGEKLYMAYNHNGTPLMNEPGTYSQADKEARDYDAATGNGSYVDLV